MVEIRDVKRAEVILAKIIDKNEISSSYSKITLIGSGMTGRPGVMAKISRILNDNDIPVIMATDSYSTISVLVKSELEISALNKLHQALVIEENK